MEGRGRVRQEMRALSRSTEGTEKTAAVHYLSYFYTSMLKQVAALVAGIERRRITSYLVLFLQPVLHRKKKEFPTP